MLEDPLIPILVVLVDDTFRECVTASVPVHLENEKVLEINPRFGPAANNLAYLYSEYGGDKEKALQLAQTAKEVLPEDPRISDTLGWILYKRGIYERAVSLLRESAEKLGDNAEVQYHLGMAYLKTGNPQAAKDSLANALKLSESFTGVEEAKRVLADLN